MKKKKWIWILLIFILIAGMAIYFYPAISDKLNRMTSEAEINKYQKTVDRLDEDEIQRMLEEAGTYNGNLPPALSMDPFRTDSADPAKEDAEYNRLLDHNGIMGYIDIPKINVYMPVGHGTSSDVLKKGAGHLYGSALPVGGEGTHAVISAHRGLPSAKLFTDLDQIEEGDTFYYHVLGRILAYQVDQIEVVEPTELSGLNPIPGEDHMTLFTCTPYGINTHRLLVRGVRIPYETKAD